MDHYAMRIAENVGEWKVWFEQDISRQEEVEIREKLSRRVYGISGTRQRSWE